MHWIQSNLATILVGVVVIAIVAIVACKLVRDKKNHKSSCLGGCSGCPSSGMCHPRRD